MRTVLVLFLLAGLAACGGDGGDAGITDPPNPDRDGDGFLNEVDACPDQAEVINNVYDFDGCPDTVPEFYAAVRVDIEAFWVAVLTGGPFPYRPITVFVSYTTPINTPCGAAELGNAFYCTIDEGVYYDFDFLQLFLDQIGDMAPAFIISHEFGHHVSKILGWAAPGVTSDKEQELQADCFAGAWTSDANDRGELEPGDLEEAVAAVISVGDPADTWFDPTAHGTALQRTVAFAIGFDGGAADCTSQAFFDLFPAPEK